MRLEFDSTLTNSIVGLATVLTLYYLTLLVTVASQLFFAVSRYFWRDEELAALHNFLETLKSDRPKDDPKN